MSIIKKLALVIVSLSLVAVSSVSSAKPFSPKKPIELIIPAGQGGGADEIARLVQNRWDDNFKNEIKLVIGDEWFAGNLSYHLNSRPKWVIELKENSKNLNVSDGIIYTGNPEILKSICPGVFGTIKPVGYCMIGRR